MPHFTSEERHAMTSLSIATLVDLMRSESRPFKRDCARELVRLRHVVREVRPVDANAILAEAASLAIEEVIREHRKRKLPWYSC
jgi:hypothetical protein